MKTLRPRAVCLLLPLVFLCTACTSETDRSSEGLGGARPDLEAMTPPERMERLVRTLASDSMEGRATASAGARRAAEFIGRELESYGIEPSIGGGFFQEVPLLRVRMANGRERLVLVGQREIPAGAEVLAEVKGTNVLGVLTGSHSERRGEAVILGAHFDHVGIGSPVDGDSIYNGADDDASGVAAVLEVARIMAGEPRPERTVIFLLTTGEESGLLGTNHYIQDPLIAMENTVADLQVEMIGRPDSLAGGAGRAWLTGYERSTLGDGLAAGGIPLVPDPRPEARFFFRSDNIAFAYIGIPAHTLSSYNMHADYHRPSDEADTMDFEHMAEVTTATAAAVRLLANGEAPAWHPGGMPERQARTSGPGGDR